MTTKKSYVVSFKIEGTKLEDECGLVLNKKNLKVMLNETFDKGWAGYEEEKDTKVSNIVIE